MKSPYIILLIIVGLIFIIYAPQHYDRWYCQMITLSSFIASIFFLNYIKGREGYFNFHTIFIFGFLIINYEHACFIYPNDELFPSLSRFPYDYNIIPYSLSVAQMGLFSYIIGSLHSYKKTSILRSYNNLNIRRLSFLTAKRKKVQFFSLLISCLVFLYVIYEFVGSHGHLYPRLMIVIVAVNIACFIYSNKDLHYGSLKDFFIINKISMLSILVFCISQIIIGSRAEVILTILPVLAFINLHVTKIKMKYLILPGFIVFLFFAIITFTRITSISFTSSSFSEVLSYGWELITSSENAFFYAQTDLIVNSRNLYDGISYVKSHDLLLGASYVPYLFAFIPFGAKTFMSFFFNKDVNDVNTAHLLSRNIGADFGIGTNIIGDIYMNFSLIGVITIMYFFGYLVQKTRQSNNPYCIILYFACLGNSLYLSRASWICWMDLFAMTSICWFFLKKSKY